MAWTTKGIEPGKTWNQLILHLITLPREGWEHEFWAITCRKIHRLTLLEEDEARHDE